MTWSVLRNDLPPHRRTPASTFPAASGAVFGAAVGGAWRACTGVVRVNSSFLTCTLPPGAGAGLSVIVIVAGQLAQSAAPQLSYDRPTLSTLMILGGGGGGPVAATAPPGSLSGGTPGGYTLAISGANLGPGGGAPQFCAFLLSRQASQALTCDGLETFEGEGEVWGGDGSGAPPPQGFTGSGAVLFWNHSLVLLSMPPGAGAPLLALSVGGQLPSAPGTAFAYAPPIVTSSTPSVGPTRGGTPITITGA